MTKTRSFFRNVLDAMIVARTRQAERQVAMYASSFPSDDLWADAGKERQTARRFDMLQSRRPATLMRVGG